MLPDIATAVPDRFGSLDAEVPDLGERLLDSLGKDEAGRIARRRAAQRER